MMFYFAVFFMSVFVDGVIRYDGVIMKQINHIFQNKYLLYIKTSYLQNYSIIVCKESKEMNE